MVKKITVTNFVNKYDKLNSEEKLGFLAQHMVMNYVPYEEKCNLCKRVIDASTKTAGRFYQNTPAQYMVYSLQLIDKYTDIQIDMTKSVQMFNMLDERGLIDDITNSIPEKEHAMLDMLLDMTRNDMYENERSVVGLLSALIDKGKALIGSLLQGIDGALDDQTVAKLKQKIKEKFGE